MRRFSQANMILFITMALFFAVSVILSVLGAVYGWYLPMWVSMFVSPLVVMGPALVYLLVKRIPLTQAIRLKKTRPVNFLLAIAVMLCAYPVVTILNMFSMIFVENAVTESISGMLYGGGLVLSLLAVAVLPGLGEELLFRGVMYNTYSRVHPIAGLLISSAAFGMMHGNFNQMPYAIFLGLVLALMMEATDSIWISMFMHFLLNGANVLMLFFADPVTAAEAAASSTMIRDLFAGIYHMGGMTLLALYTAIFFVIALAFCAAVFGLIVLTFRINHRSMRWCMTRKVDIVRKNHVFDWWQLGFVLIIIVEIVIDMVL